jgi:protocatechuate 3,4-dioxygenase beta subunit
MTVVLVSRRRLIRMSAGVVLVACGRENGAGPDAMPNGAPLAPPPPPSTSPPMPMQAPPLASGSAGPPPPAAGCIETHDNIEGPYYRAGAPDRWDLTEPGMAGTPLEIDGRVSGPGCASGLRDVELDVWHATAAGHYDNDGTMGQPGKRYLLRGRLRTDADGRYHLRTVVPGRYLNGPQYRPAHVHVKVRASGFHELTTQLYFPGDPYNDVDPFIHKSLIMGLERAQSGVKGRFDFVLRPV